MFLKINKYEYMSTCSSRRCGKSRCRALNLLSALPQATAAVPRSAFTLRRQLHVGARGGVTLKKSSTKPTTLMPKIALFCMPAAALLLVAVPQVLRDMTSESEVACELSLYPSLDKLFVSTMCSAADRLHMLNASVTVGYNAVPTFHKARYLAGVVAVQAFILVALGNCVYSIVINALPHVSIMAGSMFQRVAEQDLGRACLTFLRSPLNAYAYLLHDLIQPTFVSLLTASSAACLNTMFGGAVTNVGILNAVLHLGVAWEERSDEILNFFPR